MWKNKFVDGRILFPILGDAGIAVVFYGSSGREKGTIAGIDPADGRLLWQK